MESNPRKKRIALADRIGKKFGKLLIMEIERKVNSTKYRAICKCDCGNVHRANVDSVVSGKISSCGCIRKLPEERVGRTFNQLTILSICEKSSKGQTLARCHCSCGNEKDIVLGRVVSGEVKSCGCLHRKDFQLVAETSIYDAIKRSAIHRGLEFKLLKEEVVKLLHLPCHYCGNMESNIFKGRSKTHKSKIYKYNGIDRVDNSKGYISENVVPCCWRCNDMKGGLSKQDFHKHVENIKKYSTFIYTEKQDLTQGYPSDTGRDIVASEDVVIKARSFSVVPTELRVIIPPGFSIDVRGRSSLANKGIWAHYGTIDQDYRGPIGPILFNHTDEDYVIHAGERVGQLVIYEMPQNIRFVRVSKQEFEEHPNFLTSRGDKGFGSSGK